MARLGLESWLIWAARRIEFGRKPRYLVRVSTRYSAAVQIIHLAEKGPPWSPELVSDVQEILMEKPGVDMSLYEARFPERFDVGHSLAVIASTISSQNYSEGKRLKYESKLAGAGAEPKQKKRSQLSDNFGRHKVVSLIMPWRLISGLDLAFTPEKNLDFFPANDRHYDLCVSDRQAFAGSVLSSIHNRESCYSIMDSKNYVVQAAIALSVCIERYGDLQGLEPPRRWRDGSRLDAGEQLQRLRYLSGDRGKVGRANLH